MVDDRRVCISTGRAPVNVRMLLRVFPVVAFWSTTLLPFLLMLVLVRNEPAGEPTRLKGLSWLEIPEGHVPPLEWKEQWAQRSGGYEEEGRAVLTELPVPEVPPVPKGIPILVQGKVLKRDGWMCLFFDTDKKRWFTLSEGETDAATGLVLEPRGKTAAPVLYDRRSGLRYRVEGESNRLMKEDELDAN